MNKALLFDCDGVLADTERHAHLPAFNQMWAEFGVPWQWTAEEYGRKLKIGGGKERMASLFEDAAFRAAFQCPESEEERAELIAEWHKRKTAIYKEIITSGMVPARPGVKRLAEEALDAGWTVGVCSTSARESVEAVLAHAMGGPTADRFSLILAGDVVKAKKPAPDIYDMAAEMLCVSPHQCIVVEDSRNGLLAAHQAGMKCVVTVNDYTREEDFSEAAVVLTCLGEPTGVKCDVCANRAGVAVAGHLTVADLAVISSSAPFCRSCGTH